MVTNPEKTIPIAWYGDLVIPTDGVVALQGANGCGKTSLIQPPEPLLPPIPRGRSPCSAVTRRSTARRNSPTCCSTPPAFSLHRRDRPGEFELWNGRAGERRGAHPGAESVRLVGADHGATVIRQDPLEALQVTLGEQADELSGGMSGASP